MLRSMSSPIETGTVTSAEPSPRPRFESCVPIALDDVLQRVRVALESSSRIRGMVLPSGRIELTVSDDDRHVWSPQLTIDVSPSGESESRLVARFGPHPHVWTLYVGLYALSVIFAVCCAVWGASQIVLGESPWALYLAPIAVVFALLVYGASFVGQGMGSEQMYRVRAFLEAALEVEQAPTG